MQPTDSVIVYSKVERSEDTEILSKVDPAKEKSNGELYNHFLQLTDSVYTYSIVAKCEDIEIICIVHLSILPGGEKMQL